MKKEMNSPEKARSIRLPENVWNALDQDANRCRRSSQKQIEALLVTFYEMDDVEISKRQLDLVGEILPRGNKTTPVLPNAKVDNKKVG